MLNFLSISEMWHSKALEIACTFLPTECPLVGHIISSYQKHHAPVQETIVSPNQLIISSRMNHYVKSLQF
jgi:hypothetical protein